jgi:hypothetical protein
MTQPYCMTCWLMSLCLGARGGAPWRPWYDGGRHGSSCLSIYVSFVRETVPFPPNKIFNCSRQLFIPRTRTCSSKGSFLANSARPAPGRKKLECLVAAYGSWPIDLFRQLKSFDSLTRRPDQTLLTATWPLPLAALTIMMRAPWTMMAALRMMTRRASSSSPATSSTAAVSPINITEGNIGINAPESSFASNIEGLVTVRIVSINDVYDLTKLPR